MKCLARFRRFLARVFFGPNFKLFGQNFSKQYQEVTDEIEKLKFELEELQVTFTNFVAVQIGKEKLLGAQSGGTENLDEVFKNAIIGLDKKVELLANAVETHHEVIERIKKDFELFWMSPGQGNSN